MSRRRFLVLTTAVVGAVVLIPHVVYHYWYGKAENIIVAILRRRLGYLKHSAGSFDRFAHDYVVLKADKAPQLAKLSVVSLLLTYVTPYDWLPRGHALRRLEDNVVGTYLMSTGFFRHGDESRRLDYQALYDPLRAPCTNDLYNLRVRLTSASTDRAAG